MSGWAWSGRHIGIVDGGAATATGAASAFSPAKAWRMPGSRHLPKVTLRMEIADLVVMAVGRMVGLSLIYEFTKRLGLRIV